MFDMYYSNVQLKLRDQGTFPLSFTLSSKCSDQRLDDFIGNGIIIVLSGKPRYGTRLLSENQSFFICGDDIPLDKIMNDGNSIRRPARHTPKKINSHAP